jgi:hypothetical protein
MENKDYRAGYLGSSIDNLAQVVRKKGAPAGPGGEMCRIKLVNRSRDPIA